MIIARMAACDRCTMSDRDYSSNNTGNPSILIPPLLSPWRSQYPQTIRTYVPLQLSQHPSDVSPETGLIQYSTALPPFAFVAWPFVARPGGRRVADVAWHILCPG